MTQSFNFEQALEDLNQVKTWIVSTPLITEVKVERKRLF